MTAATDNLEPKYRVGYAGTFLFVGDLVKVRGRGFGRGCTARVLALGGLRHRICEIKLVTVGKNTNGWVSGIRTIMHCGCLEGVTVT